MAAFVMHHLCMFHMCNCELQTKNYFVMLILAYLLEQCKQFTKSDTF